MTLFVFTVNDKLESTFEVAKNVLISPECNMRKGIAGKCDLKFGLKLECTIPVPAKTNHFMTGTIY